MRPTDKAAQAGRDILAAFRDRAAIETANADLCAFILAAAELAATEPVAAEMIGAIMEPDETEAEWEARRDRVRIVIRNTVPPEQSRPPRPDEIWENADPDAGLKR
ncbi:hypothetical protein PMNALOAF_2695 [Methylobacterium adhaesivum]|uniref:Uncharacterized protein n=1 Tax=Methylobacterium adhaesivum TaxID=333297 RepID=A0ABT8BJX1_9HYPH|nr:hypothetical protein [Methylobacterium adhaesivum]MDN3592049.1 hypothetical protein [Methylobacterium adhaesivum]GJD31436.1 hypothetical protein PMNALOAF_2695 [Methylobacterium adhaesivum]